MLKNYQRPEFEEPDHFDEHGKLITYGDRWDTPQPPDDSYSVTSHPERFTPVHLVANALLEWLCDRFEVRCFDDPMLVKELRLDPADVVRSVRILPANTACAPIGLVFTNYPGVHLSVGALFQASFPPCGCDACDEPVSDILEDMEFTIGAVTSGTFTEQLDTQAKRLVHRFGAEELGFSESSRGIDDISPALLGRARVVLPPQGAWAPWPVR